MTEDLNLAQIQLVHWAELELGIAGWRVRRADFSSSPRYLFLQKQEIAKLFFNLILLTFLLTLIWSIFASILTAFLCFRQELHDIRAAYSKSKTFYIFYIIFIYFNSHKLS